KKDTDQREQPVPAEPVPDVVPETPSVVNAEELQEREMVQLLLNYADSTLEEDVDLLTYFISEFEDVEFVNESYAYIYNAFLKARNEGQLIDSKWLLDNCPDHIKSVIAELTIRKYYASPHFGPKYNIFFTDEKEKLVENVHNNVLSM